MVVTILKERNYCEIRILKLWKFWHLLHHYVISGSHERRGRICFYFWYPHTTVKSVSSRSSCLHGCAIWVCICISRRHLSPAVLTYYALALRIQSFGRRLCENQYIRVTDLSSMGTILAGNSRPDNLNFKAQTLIFHTVELPASTQGHISTMHTKQSLPGPS